MALDPTNWVSMGAKPYAEEAMKAIKSSPDAVAALMRGSGSAIQPIKMAGDLTESTIKSIAAPRVMSQHLTSEVDTLSRAAEAERNKLLATGQYTSPALEDMESRTAAIVKAQEHLTPGTVGPTAELYKKALEGARNGPGWKQTPWGVGHEKITGNSVSDQMKSILRKNSQGIWEVDPDALARHQVLAEKRIAHDLPRTRYMGANVTPAGWSPTTILGKSVARMAGKYNETTGLTRTTEEMKKTLQGKYDEIVKRNPGTTMPFHPDDYTKGVERLAGVYDPTEAVVKKVGLGKMPAGHVWDLLQGQQVGTSIHSLQTGVDSNFSGLLKPLGGENLNEMARNAPMQRWLEAYTEQFPANERDQVLKEVHAMYHTLQMTLEKNPKLATFDSVKGLKQAQDVVANFRNSRAIPTALLPGAQRLSYPQEVERIFKQSSDNIEQWLSNAHATVSGFSAGPQIPGGLIDSMNKAREIYKDLDSGGKMNQSFRQHFTAMNDLLRSRAPKEFNNSYVSNMMEWQRNGRKNAAMASSIRDSVEQYLKSHPDIAGVDVLGRVDPKEWASGVADMAANAGNSGKHPLQIMADMARQLKLTLPNGNGDVDALARKVKQTIYDGLQDRMRAHGMTKVEGDAAGDLIKKLTPEELYHLTNQMHHTATARAASGGSLRQALNDMGLEGFSNYLEQTKNAETKLWNKYRLPYENTWGYSQWQHDPTKLGALWSKTMEPAINATLRWSGWPQRLQEAFTHWEGRRNSANKLSEQEIFGKWHQKELPDIFRQVAGRELSPQEASALDIAYRQWSGHRHGVLEPSAFTGVPGLPSLGGRPANTNPRLQAIHDIAAPVTDKAYSVMDKMFGGGLGGEWSKGYRNPKVEQATRNIQDGINTKMGGLETLERNSGQKVPHRTDYIPTYLYGDPKEQQRFWDTLDRIDEDSMRATGPSEAKLSKKQAYEQHRQYPSDAHLQFDINRANDTLKSEGAPPLDLRVDESLGSVMMKRYLAHHLGQANLSLMGELSDVLPDHAFTMLPRGSSKILKGKQTAESSLDELGKAHGFADLGELSESLRGHWVAPRLYKFLEGHLNPYGSEPSEAEVVSDLFSKPFYRMQRYLKRMNVGFTGAHIRNQMANALVADGPGVWSEAGSIVSDAVKQAVGGKKFAKWSQEAMRGSPVMPIGRALQDTDLYNLGVQYGLFRNGQEYSMPIQDLWRMRANPPGVMAGFKNAALQQGGPLSALTFDVVDTSLRMAMFKRFMAKGMTPARAAEMVDHAMIDYSMRYLTPGARRAAYGLLQFPSWAVGNWLAHGKRMIENPMWYSLQAHAIEELNNNREHRQSPMDKVALANALALGHTVPGSANNSWLRPGFPWQPMANLESQAVGDIAGNQPMALAKDVLGYAGNRLLGFPWGVAAKIDELRSPQVQKEGLKGYLFGSPGKSGVVGDTFWGASGYGLNDWWKIWTDPSMWNRKSVERQWDKTRLPYPIGGDTAGFVKNFFAQTVEQSPTGKIIY
jgi:hypothetical protein